MRRSPSTSSYRTDILQPACTATKARAITLTGLTTRPSLEVAAMEREQLDALTKRALGLGLSMARPDQALFGGSWQITFGGMRNRPALGSATPPTSPSGSGSPNPPSASREGAAPPAPAPSSPLRPADPDQPVELHRL